MSTFGGKIQEFPGTSVDRFDGDNGQSEVYFLSHCHTDHMVGLGSVQFQKNLIDNGKYIFGSPITCIILCKMYPDIKNNLKELSAYAPTNIKLKSSAFSVTTFPAGHCPGSVMFLFEGKLKILYTGDFRVHKGDIRKFKYFYDSFNNVKCIDKIYLDTTFFSKEFLKFPKREDSLNELCMIIKEWLDMGSLYMINLITSAKYGYEYLFIEIYRTLGMPIHVNQEVYDFYCLIPEMDKSITTIGSVTRIHSSCGPTHHTTCSYKTYGVVKPVKVSAFRWNQENLSKGISVVDPYMHYVCYSTHASYEEAVDLIQFLKPKEVEVCVKPPDPLAYSNLKKSIEEILDAFEKDVPVVAEVDGNVPKLFKIDDSIDKKETKNIPDEEKQKKMEILDEDELTTIMDLQPHDPYGHMLDSPPRGDIKEPTDVLTTIMSLSPENKTLKGIIKRKTKSLKHERSFALLDSLTETSSCSSQREDSNCIEDDCKSILDSGTDATDDYERKIFLDKHDKFDPRKELSTDIASTSKAVTEVLTNKMVITDSNGARKKLDALEIYDLFVPQPKKDAGAGESTNENSVPNRNEFRKHSDNTTRHDEFDLRLRTDESMMEKGTADSETSSTHEPERNFLLEIIESEPNPVSEIQTIANESGAESDCSALYDILGISPPQK
nr:unnamed protein product [Callosobruchus chinensis]